MYKKYSKKSGLPIDKCVYRVYTVYIRYVQSDEIQQSEEHLMEIYISNSSPKPIYEQITDQIKAAIISGALREGDPLPSIRFLAKELRISVITTKRAYEDLEQAGFINTVPGKGCFVAPQNPALHHEEALKAVEAHLQKAVEAAELGCVSRGEVFETLTLLYEGD